MTSAPVIKFCGLTRPEDAAEAAALGAAFVGVIFAGGPRERGVAVAGSVVAAAVAAPVAAGTTPARVGVFGADFATRIPDVMAGLTLDVVQLHADPTVADVARARAVFPGRVWAAVRVEGSVLPAGTAELAQAVDGIVLDARVAGGPLGGTGAQIAWTTVSDAVRSLRVRGVLVVAGGLTAENVEEAVRVLGPDVVDVSSGVEATPGVKDHRRMAAFAAAVQRSSR